MRRFKICHLLYEEFPRDPRVRRYVNALNSAGEKCVIICSKKKHDKYFQDWNGNRVYRIPVAKRRQSFFLTGIEYWVFAKIAAFLLLYLSLKYRFKIIHVHTLPDFLIFSALPEKLFGAKLILDLHELFPEIFAVRKPHLANSVWMKILLFQERISIKLADAVITIHEPARDIFVSRNKNLEKKIVVIMNSVDPSEIPVSGKTSHSGFNIIYNGTVVKLLNLTMIVEALAILRDRIPVKDFDKIDFIIYGDGPAVPEILKRAEELKVTDKVVYRGFVEPDKIWAEISQADVCILPPVKNLYSDLFYTIKLIEMVYLKIPVIATRLNTYKRYYTEDALFYFDSGNAEELCERIKEVFYTPLLVKSKTEKAFEEYSRIGWNVMRERYLKLITQLS